MKTQATRLQYILSELQITPYEFSKVLGYKSPDSIYHVLNGIQNISTNMLNRIRNTEYEINENWLITEKGTPFVKRVTKGEYGNEYFSNGIVIYPARLNFYDIRKLAGKLADVIFYAPDSNNYTVKARASLNEGLEFIYTTYYIESNKRHYDKQYALSISPNWKITNFFDYWRLEQKTRRCQNLLYLTNDSRLTYAESFETKVREILDELDEYYFEEEIDSNKFDSECKTKDGFVELYETDSRK